MGVHRLDKIRLLGMIPPFDDFIAFKELFISAGHSSIYETHVLALSKLGKVLKEVTEFPPVRKVFAACPTRKLIRQRLAEIETLYEEPNIQENFEDPPVAPPIEVHVEGAIAVPPPPPPPPPIPPRPGFWRFPGAEFSDKGRGRPPR